MEHEEKDIIENEAEVSLPDQPEIKEDQPREKAGSKSHRKGSGHKDPSQKKSPEVDSEYIEKVLAIRRVTKVTKGGKKMSFSALVVVGDGKSHVGYAQEKAGEVALAIRKSMATAKKKMVKISLKGTTIPHEIVGVWGGASVLLKPAGEGTGVIASGPVRAICDGAGIHNILTKCHRSNNPVNVVKATMDGLTRLKSAKTVKNIG
jgi:small subunit ribosomal protein S5